MQLMVYMDQRRYAVIHKLAAWSREYAEDPLNRRNARFYCTCCHCCVNDIFDKR